MNSSTCVVVYGTSIRFSLRLYGGLSYTAGLVGSFFYVATPLFPKDIFMDSKSQPLPVSVPESVYLQALEYLPESITEELFTLTSTEHAGIMVTRNLDRLDATPDSVKIRAIEKHYSSRWSKNIIYLPLICEIPFILYLMFNRMLTPTILLVTSFVALLLTTYLALKLKHATERGMAAITLLRNIELYTALVVSNRSRQYLTDVLAQADSLLSVTRNDVEELRIRYEGALNYFYKADAKLTNEYIHATSSTPINVVQHEGIQ